MSLKDKLELGLKPDAPYRPDNLPDFQQDDADCQTGATPGESAHVEKAREECTNADERAAATAPRRRRRKLSP